MSTAIQVNGLRTGSRIERKFSYANALPYFLCLFRKTNSYLDSVLGSHLHPSSTPGLLVKTVPVSKWLVLSALYRGVSNYLV